MLCSELKLSVVLHNPENSDKTYCKGAEKSRERRAPGMSRPL